MVGRTVVSLQGTAYKNRPQRLPVQRDQTRVLGIGTTSAGYRHDCSQIIAQAIVVTQAQRNLFRYLPYRRKEHPVCRRIASGKLARKKANSEIAPVQAEN